MPGVPFAKVRKLALALPGIEEGTSYGTPAFRVGRKFLGRLSDDGENLVLKIGFDERELLMRADPRTFHITDHYRGYPMVLVRLASVAPAQLREILEQAWGALSPARRARPRAAAAAREPRRARRRAAGARKR
jgi:hypothetical protein